MIQLENTDQQQSFSQTKIEKNLDANAVEDVQQLVEVTETAGFNPVSQSMQNLKEIEIPILQKIESQNSENQNTENKSIQKDPSLQKDFLNTDNNQEGFNLISQPLKIEKETNIDFQDNNQQDDSLVFQDANTLSMPSDLGE